MIKYRYEIHCYSPLGEIYDECSTWYSYLDTCEFNCLKKINSNKFKKTLFNNECTDINCVIDIFITTNEKINRKNINHLSKQQFFTQYKIIKHTKNLTPDCLLLNENQIDFEENIIFKNKCKIMKENKDVYRKQPNNELLNLLIEQIKEKCGYTPNIRWINMAYMLKINPLELSWKNYEDNCNFRAELAEKLNITQKELFDRYNKIFDFDLVAENLYIGYKLKNDMRIYIYSINN